MNNSQLVSAVNEIKSVMKCPVIQEPDIHITHIIDKCNNVFGTFQSFLSQGESEGFLNYKNTLLDQDKRPIRKRRKMLSDEDLKNSYNNQEYIASLDNAGRIFPFFVDFDFGKIMQISKDKHVLAILPYLLTSFYFNSNRLKNRRVRDSINAVFSCAPGTTVSGYFIQYPYYRDMQDFCRLFTYIDFLPNLFKCGRSDSKTTLGEIKDIDSFRNYIETAFMRDKNDNQRYDTKLYYSQIYKVLIYSIIASACSEELGDSAEIDYIESWHLFAAHTDAFAAASFALARKTNCLDNPDAYFIRALLECFGTYDSIGKDVDSISELKENLDSLKMTVNLERLRNLVMQDGINLQEVYQCYTYFFRIFFNPFVYFPFQPLRIVDNLIDKERVAYIVMHPRKKKMSIPEENTSA